MVLARSKGCAGWSWGECVITYVEELRGRRKGAREKGGVFCGKCEF